MRLDDKRQVAPVKRRWKHRGCKIARGLRAAPENGPCKEREAPHEDPEKDARETIF